LFFKVLVIAIFLSNNNYYIVMTIFTIESLAELLSEEYGKKTSFEIAERVLRIMGYDGVVSHSLLSKEDLLLFNELEERGFIQVESFETTLYTGKEYRYYIYKLMPGRNVKEYTPMFEEWDLLNLLSTSPLHKDMIDFYGFEKTIRKLSREGIINESPLDGGTYFINYSRIKHFSDKLNKEDGLLISFLYNELKKGSSQRGPYSLYSRIKSEFGEKYDLEYVKSLTREAIKLLLAEEVKDGTSVNDFEKKYHIDVSKYGINGSALRQIGIKQRYGFSKEKVLEEILERFGDYSGKLSRDILRNEMKIDIYNYGLTFGDVIRYLRENGVDVIPNKLIEKDEAEGVILSYLTRNEVAEKREILEEVSKYINEKWGIDISWDNKKIFKQLEDDGLIVRVKTSDSSFIALSEDRDKLERVISEKYVVVNGHYFRKDTNMGEFLLRLIEEGSIPMEGTAVNSSIKYLVRMGIVKREGDNFVLA
jgi:hypothetical protein